MSDAASQLPPAPDGYVFKSSLGLKIMMGVTFFLAVAFTVNAIVGSTWLAQRNLWLDALIFLLLFAAGCWIVFYGALFLFSATNTEVKIEADRVLLTIPNWKGPTPFFPYTRLSIPYQDIAAIETRCEIYRYYILPVAVRGLYLRKKDGRRYTIGYTRENADENAFAYDEVAAELSRRTGLPLTHVGTVKAGTRLRALIHDEPPADAACLSDEEAARLTGAEGRAWRMALIVIAVVLIGGLIFQGVRIVTSTFS